MSQVTLRYISSFLIAEKRATLLQIRLHWFPVLLDATKRLGLGSVYPDLRSLPLPLPKPTISPFGIEVAELAIPGHMAPDSHEPEITGLEHCEGGFHFYVADRHYRYTRMGLEVVPMDGDTTPA